MSEEHSNLPVTSDDAAFLQAAGLENMKMSTGLAIFMKPSLYNHCKAVALRMSEARGVIGDHLIGQPSACMAILSRAITWNLDPFAVAQCTYAVKGKVGYEGKLIQAILENSGQLDGPIKYTYSGDWAKLRGKFKMEDSRDGGKKAVATWKPEDEDGLSILITAQVKGEAHPREEEFFLAEMWPRNSTLWATRPKQQMIYTSIRAFGNIAMPGVLMGIPFDVDAGELGSGTGMTDINPRPTKGEFVRDVRNDTKLQDWIVKLNFATRQEDLDAIEIEGTKDISPDHHERWHELCDARAAAIKLAEEKQKAEQEAPEPVDDTPAEEPTAEQAGKAAEEAQTDDELIHLWGDRLAAVKDVKDVADLRAEGLKELPEHLRDRWADGCDARAKSIADKPRGKNGKAKAADDSEKETALHRGKRLLPKVGTVEDIQELRNSIMEELTTKGAKVEWEDLCVTRLKEVTAPQP